MKASVINLGGRGGQLQENRKMAAIKKENT